MTYFSGGGILARERRFTDEELFQATGELLLQLGYEAFTFSLLAAELEVSRGTLYKYYKNKDELIIHYMLYEMREFLLKLKEIHKRETFEEQFEFLLALIFENSSIHHLIEIGMAVPKEKDENIKRLNKKHLEMYEELMEFIHLGKKEQKLKADLPDSLLLGFIFQTISIPNHYRVPREEWVSSIKEVLRHGMFTKT